MARTAAILAVLGLSACAAGDPAPAAAPADGRTTWEGSIRALFEKRCGDCHGPKSPDLAEFNAKKQHYKDEEIGPRMDTYEHLMVFVNGADTGALMRRLDDGRNTKDGKPGNMFNHLGETPAERAASLAVVKSWVGGWSLKRKAEITEAERAAVLSPRR